MKRCPFCAEEIQDEAKVCKHCGKDLEKKHSFAKALLVASLFVVILGLLSSIFSTKERPSSSTPPSQSLPNQPTQAPSAVRAPPGFPYFSDGTHIIGQDIAPGTYRTRVASSGCYYARLAGFGGDLEQIIANDNTDSPAVVTISATDKGFVSNRCGIWTQDLSAISVSRTSFGDGMYIVGTDIEPGTYRNSGQHSCYYARLGGFGGSLQELIANENADSPAVVTISLMDRGFKSSRCGTWMLISGAQPGPQNESNADHAPLGPGKAEQEDEGKRLESSVPQQPADLCAKIAKAARLRQGPGSHKLSLIDLFASIHRDSNGCLMSPHLEWIVEVTEALVVIKDKIPRPPNISDLDWNIASPKWELVISTRMTPSYMARTFIVDDRGVAGINVGDTVSVLCDFAKVDYVDRVTVAVLKACAVIH